MGNKFVKQPGKASKPSAKPLFSQQQEGPDLDESTLEAELQAAHEAAMALSKGVDMLANELRLEQQLAALDDEAVQLDNDNGQPFAAAGEEEELELDPAELAELEDELQELEREVLGADDDGGAAAGAALAGGEGAAAAAEDVDGQEQEQEQGVGNDGGRQSADGVAARDVRTDPGKVGR